MKLFDTHTHLNVHQFDEDREETYQRAKDAGVEKMIVVGFDTETIESALAFAESHDDVFAACGWHPVDAIDMTERDLNYLEELALAKKIVALGEMGLDYHWDKSPADVQKEVFVRQIQLAKRTKLPIIIHNREATRDVVDILKAERAEEVGGVMHCFAGDVDIAKECLDMGFYISFGGPVTFKNAHMPKEVAKIVPADRLLIETDCPFLAPHPYRGKRNEPAYVRLVCEQIAALRDEPEEDVAQQTYDNACRLFGLNL
ncbi:TatD family hydrolase [Aureibacillus halotolerans]|uniref:TatD DNase family protein n=1 Tax=Aureibacillus halotolerans TaxID=1508390 RepID=A0A4R6TQR0_9BACI|nr:TatD family hydrolase [Aureibacillus halotolerans]TDQ34242.1 TatD DNase family protein [Aureibacillus halotolerans]